MPTSVTRLAIASCLIYALSAQAADTQPEDASQPAVEQAAPEEASAQAAEVPAAATDSPAAEPEKPGFWSRQWNKVVDTYHAPDSELYIPLNTWHNRSKYTREKIDSFNENPWGLGYGKYRVDEDGDLHSVYAMVFMDSHNDPEPFFGYAFDKLWHPSQNLRVGLGFTLGITMRSDENYVPIPAVLPILSVGYRRFTLETTYIPGGNGNGNILFTWMRWRL